MNTITSEVFNEIYLDKHKPLLSFAHKLLKDHSESLDVVQTVFLKLLKQDYDKIKDHIDPWLFTVTRNTALKTLAKSKRYSLQPTENIEEEVSPELNPLELLQSIEKTDSDYATLHTALTKMKPRTLAIIKLRFFDNCSYQEISEKLQISVGNVGFILCTTLRGLRRLLHKSIKNTKCPIKSK
jgi:RNA polymerase sigma-70 factor (ECF subfamily)